MNENPNDERERLLDHIADRRTTRSFKRTLNTAVLLRAMRDHSASHAAPRRAGRLAVLLSGALLLVGQHGELLRTLFHLP